MDWKHGYFADGGYTFGYYAETMPTWIHWACLIQGHLTPISKFRYLDAGCGQGLNLILAAAAHPDSEFVGIDFMPEHIAHATRLAADCGLSNVTFIEGDFIELSKNPHHLGEFDYAICHGITTWISQEVKDSLFELIGRCLKPGGVFYNSYNTFPGWLGAVPFQHLVLQLQRFKDGKSALNDATAMLGRLQSGAGLLNTSLPGLGVRLKSLNGLDPDYLVQEYNNHYWQPVFVSKMMEDLAKVKLSYLGTATLSEAFTQVLPQEIRDLVNEQRDPSLREQLRDYGVNQSFRRDLYIKGRMKPWAGQEQELVTGTRFIVNPLAARPEADQPYVVKYGSLALNGDSASYGGLLEQLGQANGGMTVGELRSNLADENLASLPLMLSLLLSGGWVYLFSGSETHNGSGVNIGLAQSAGLGAPYRYLSLPKAGGAISVSDIDCLLYDLSAHGVDRKKWPDQLLASLTRLGRALVKDGKAVTNPEEQQQILEDQVARFDKKLAFMKQMGAL